MWSGHEHSSLNPGVKSSQQALDCMAEQSLSKATQWLDALVKGPTLVKGALCYCVE